MLSFNSQLTYASLIWMFAGKRSTAKICKYTFEHFKLFLIVMKNHIITCWISVMFLPPPPPFLRHLRFLAIEVYKSLMNINPEFMWEFFSKNPVQCNLWKGDIVHLPPARSSCYGINPLHFRRSLLWNSLPSNEKESHNLEKFKLKIKNFGNIHCTCVVS